MLNFENWCRACYKYDEMSLRNKNSHFLWPTLRHSVSRNIYSTYSQYTWMRYVNIKLKALDWFEYFSAAKH